MKRPAHTLVVLGLLLLSGALAPARAYIGPGIGLGVIGSVFGMFWAILLAVVMVLAWPMRMLWKKWKRRQRERAETIPDQPLVTPSEPPSPDPSASAG